MERVPQQESLELRLREDETPYRVNLMVPDKEESSDDSIPEPPTPAGRLMAAVTTILRDLLTEPMTDQEVAELLNVSKPQVKAWLGELVTNRMIEKLSKPVRYRVVKGADRLL
jgi:hypothetical protein